MPDKPAQPVQPSTTHEQPERPYTRPGEDHADPDVSRKPGSTPESDRGGRDKPQSGTPGATQPSSSTPPGSTTSTTSTTTTSNKP